MLAAALAATKAPDPSWWSENSTLIVGVVGIVFSGFVGPTVTALWTARREKQKDHRAAVLSRRDDLRVLVDEAARVLSGAVPEMRHLLQAHLAGAPLPEAPMDFLATLFPLEQRLALRVGRDHPVVSTFEESRQALVALSEATTSDDTFTKARKEFESQRSRFLEASQTALHAPIEKDTQI